MITKTDISSKQLFPLRFPEAVLSVKTLACERGGRTVFQNISFDVKSGEALHITGGNGVGKSSLLKMLAGSLRPQSGSILWNQEEYDDENRDDHLARLAFLPPDDRHIKVLETVWENMRFWARINGQVADDYIYNALTVTGLLPHQSVQSRKLSAGQKRRLSLSQMLLRQAPLWLLDEPLNALDHHAAGVFNDLLKNHLDAGGIAVIASHQPVAAAKTYEVVA